MPMRHRADGGTGDGDSVGAKRRTMNERDAKPPFLARWSQRKLAASRAASVPAAPQAGPLTQPDTVPASTGAAVPIAAPIAAPDAAPGAAAALPDVESLTFDSDFTPFLRPEIEPGLRQSALRKLLRDPRFNVVDGLDVYIDDYGKPDPIAPELVRKLVQSRYLFDPPQTRVNERGEVEEVADEPVPAAAEDAPGAPDAAPPRQLPVAAPTEPIAVPRAGSALPSGSAPTGATEDTS